MKGYRGYLIHLGTAVILALIIRFFFITAYKVPTGSMQPTLLPGDFIFVNRMSYVVGAPAVGDIVAFKYPQQPRTTYVKRIVALAGDKVEFQKGRLVINDTATLQKVLPEALGNPNPLQFELAEEKLVNGPSIRIIQSKVNAQQDLKAFAVAPGEVFVLGDNRDTSDDSRDWGPVPQDQILGKIWIVWFSWDSKSKSEGKSIPSVRWNRLFSAVQ